MLNFQFISKFLHTCASVYKEHARKRETDFQTDLQVNLNRNYLRFSFNWYRIHHVVLERIAVHFCRDVAYSLNVSTVQRSDSAIRYRCD